jgi:hypothetical protein
MEVRARHHATQAWRARPRDTPDSDHGKIGPILGRRLCREATRPASRARRTRRPSVPSHRHVAAVKRRCVLLKSPSQRSRRRRRHIVARTRFRGILRAATGRHGLAGWRIGRSALLPVTRVDPGMPKTGIWRRVPCTVAADAVACGRIDGGATTDTGQAGDRWLRFSPHVWRGSFRLRLSAGLAGQRRGGPSGAVAAVHRLISTACRIDAAPTAARRTAARPHFPAVRLFRFRRASGSCQLPTGTAMP